MSTEKTDAEIRFEQKLLDIALGKPANGFYWGGCVGTLFDPPRFNEIDGKKYLRSVGAGNMKRRQKDQPKGWCITDYHDLEYTESEDGEYDVFTWRTPLGTVCSRRREAHFTEYPVKSAADLEIWNYVFQHTSYRLNPEYRSKYLPHILGLKNSPVQRLLQSEIGIENFYYFLEDEPGKMTELLCVMQERTLERFRIAIDSFPSIPCICLGENTSSSAISPQYYEKLTLPHIQDYVKLCHSANKRLIVHMCGLLNCLLDSFAKTDMDGIDMVTPPPIGDTPFDLVRKKMKPDLTITGRLNAQLWIGKSKTEIQEIIREMVSEEILQTPFVLVLSEDAIENIPEHDVMVVREALTTMKW